MSMVTEEVLNVALISYHRTRPHEGAIVAMRAALAAVAPLIAARERELCLAIAQLEHDYAAEDIEIATNIDDETGRLQAEGAAHAANRICNAIRAFD